MLLVVECEVDPDCRYFVPEMGRYLPEHEVYDLVNEGTPPPLDEVDAVVLSGSTAGVYERDDHEWISSGADLVHGLVERELPTLGVCFGHQLVNEALGGRVEAREKTARLVDADLDDDPLFDGVSTTLPMVHGDHVVERGDGMRVIGSADYYPNLATRHRDVPLWTVQYHPEFTGDLLPEIDRDFGWEGAEDFSAVSVERTFENFVRLAGVGE